MNQAKLLTLTAAEITTLLKGGLVEREGIAVGLEHVNVRVHVEIKNARPGALISIDIAVETPTQDRNGSH
jgi:hypothetical protein